MTTQPLVLAIDDEPSILRLLKLELTAQGIGVITAGEAEEGLRLFEEQRPDLVLLDVIMPGMTGIEVMRRLREHTGVPVILLTAKDSDSDKVQGLSLGADDYIVKPFNPEEVGARIWAVLRRSTRDGGTSSVLRANGIEIDLDRRLVSRGGRQVDLTRTEWLLLQHLASNPGRVLINAELLTKVWGPEYRDDLQYLRVWISRLRRKLEDDSGDPQLIKTKQGIGYILDAEPAASTVTV